MQEIYIWLALFLPYMLASIMEIFLSAIYIYCGWGEAEYRIETLGPAQGGKKAYPHINPSLTRGLELEEQAFLENHQAS